ncbi:TlpA family protein disulfide reductase [Zhouia amylolytica]|uniref:Thioredoxin domain-containing protein n=1 Tax=Zhouia amylolytica AD3 TaxID=1286632 RepID=W2UQA6_9FLAO|nr:TlpA disulfide reductase family protein [Zhouia amylolytica]ETN96144.1 hypothetical protein P278_09450 [Zhouia amylolytica AD3]
MKKIITILIFAFLLMACQIEKRQFEVKGKVSNNSKDYALFIYDTTGIGISTLIDTVYIDDTGNFTVKDKHPKSRSSLIFNEEDPIRLAIQNQLNSSIEIDLNVLKPDSIKIHGDQAPMMKYYLDQQEFWSKIFKDKSGKHPEIASGNNQSLIYHKVQDTITNKRIQYLLEYFNNTEILNQEDFINMEKNSLIYENLYYRMSGQKNDLVKQLKFYQEANADSIDILTYSDKVSFSDKSLFSNYFYRKFINNVIMDVVRFENPASNHSSYELYLHKGLAVINEWYKDPELNKLQKIIFIDHLISNAITFKNPINIYEFQQRIEILKRSKFANEYLSILEDKLLELDELISKFSKGSKAPDFKLEDREGTLYESSDFKNKVLFIDVWASWCGPCISSFPKWNKLVEDYSENRNDYEFITVSMDKDRDKWINSLDKLNLKGLKLFAGPKAFNSQFATSFKINALSSYIAIDDKGNIISISSSIGEFEKIIRQTGSKE